MMTLVVANFGYSGGGWRVERHPRFLADLTGDGRADIVGFGDGGVWRSLNNGDGTFAAPQRVIQNFAFSAGGWRVARHPRFLADLTGDGRADIVGFGDGGVWRSLNNGDGTFAAPQLVVANFGYTAGGWRVERHPRFLADVTGDGRADIVGFGDGGVWVSRNNGNGTFSGPTLEVADFAYTAGGWRVERHPRFVVDVTGDGRADIVGFGDGGVWVSLNNGNGTFSGPTLEVANFAYTAGGWRVERHPRFLADVTGDGRPDIVGFGDGGVWVSLNNGNGTFAEPKLAVEDFAYTAGGWRVERHPRFLADLTGDGRADIVGFGDGGVWTSLSTGGGNFDAPRRVIDDFGYTAGGWRVERHPRLLADLTGDGRADVVGFGDAGVWASLNNGDGTFEQTYVRRDVGDLQAPWDPITLAYANAIKAMQARPLSDPTSWTYQAAIHGRNGTPPSGALWNECQHQSWYFLPWHRLYLYWFERIVRAEVIAQGGPVDWALPYWDYDDPGRAQLPAAFRQPTMPDGSVNPLFHPQRGFGWNTGQASLPPTTTSSAGAMSQIPFVPDFGGGAAPGPTQFFGDAGDLEFTPHNGVHGLISGDMGNPFRAALDPIFWLHHANVDRLWTVWLGRGGGRANPVAAGWLNQSFTLHDEAGAQVPLTVAATLDTAGQLGYVYAEMTESAFFSVEGLQDDAAEGAEPVTDPPSAGLPPELVGAADGALELAGAPTGVEVVMDQRAMQGRAAESGRLAPSRVYLNLEDVVAEQNPAAVYEVFVRAAEGDTPHYVGNVSFFGIEQTTGGPAAGEGAHGFRRTFDITAPVADMRARGVWDEQRLVVTVRPVTPMITGELPEDEARELARTQALPVRIGRVSVFYA